MHSDIFINNSSLKFNQFAMEYLNMLDSLSFFKFSDFAENKATFLEDSSSFSKNIYSFDCKFVEPYFNFYR